MLINATSTLHVCLTLVALQTASRNQPKQANKDIYAEPPPLSQTLFGSKDKEKRKDEPPTFFNQTFLTVGSLVLIAIFLVASGGSDLVGLVAPRQPAPQVFNVLCTSPSIH